MFLSLKQLKHASRTISCVGLIGVTLLAGGCGGTSFKEFYFGDLFGKSDKEVQKNPDQLAVEGTQKMRDKDYEDAAKAFKSLKEHFPYSKYAILAELKLGDAQFHDKKYSEAALSYEEFVRLHPRNEVVPYVLYQIGMCHFLSFSTIDRDMDETRLASESFQKLMQAFPQSNYALKAKKQLFECQKRLAFREFYIGRFYYRTGEYAAAKQRLDKVKNEYAQAAQELGLQKDLDKMLAKANKEVAKGPKQPSIWAKMGF